MKAFSALLRALIFAPRRTVKLRHLASWLQDTPHPDRGWGLAVLTGDLMLSHARPAVVRELASEVTGQQLFSLSYDFVGDLAETTALLWPDTKADMAAVPTLDMLVTQLQRTQRAQIKQCLRGWLDIMDSDQRWALLKMVTGGLRVGVSGRLARLALAEAFGREIEEIEEIWPLVTPPYTELFQWLEGSAARPSSHGRAVFRPVMLAHPIDTEQAGKLDMSQWQFEWKWDGIRVQLASAEDGVRLFSRTGDDISAAFPELSRPMRWRGVLDGELLAGSPERLGSFNDLQQRLNRKRVSARMIADNPVFMRIYDLLVCGDDDIRSWPLTRRRALLSGQHNNIDLPAFDLSEILAVSDAENLERLRCASEIGVQAEGLMIKAKGSAYLAGRPRGCWYKFKRDPFRADLVVLYAQRGHGRRSSLYSDYTLGAWQAGDGGPQLVPVCKAYSGFSDKELSRLDKFVREHTINRFGPVREVEHKLVVEVAFDSVHRSRRHKSGLAMRFPRFHAIRWDKQAEQADDVATIMGLIADNGVR